MNNIPKLWVPETDNPNLQRALLFQMSQPPTYGQLEILMVDKLERLLVDADDPVGDLEPLPDLQEAYLMANDSPRSKATWMISADSIHYHLSRSAGTKGKLSPHHQKDYREQTLQSLVADLAESL